MTTNLEKRSKKASSSPAFPLKVDGVKGLCPAGEKHAQENIAGANGVDDANIMGHIVIPDQPGPDAGIMDWSRYLSELDKLPQDDEGVQVAIQGARDMIAELEWLKPEGPENPR